MFDLSPLSLAIETGDRDKAIELTNAALSSGVGPQSIISDGLQAGMGVVGEKFSSGEYFLPDMLLAARAMNSSLEILKPLLEGTELANMGKVVIGTVEGDLHDIGKNVVATLLRGNGFEVIDLGTNVPDRKFVDEVRAQKADILGLSALLTTTMPVMQRVIKALDEVGLRSDVKVVIGGAPVTQDFANHIGADGYARDGGRAVPVCKQMMSK